MEMFKKSAIFIGVISGVFMFWLLANTLLNESDSSAQKTKSQTSSPQPLTKNQARIIDNPLSFSIGPKDARIVVVTFIDFQCEFCRLASPVFHRLISLYKDASVRFVFRHLPLESIHPVAIEAARASLCAREQGKFLEMHDRLFENQERLSITLFPALAEQIKLNAPQFQICMNQEKYQSILQKDASDAQDIGLTGVPAVFINNQLFTGVASLEIFRTAIDRALSQ